MQFKYRLRAESFVQVDVTAGIADWQHKLPLLYKRQEK